MYRKVFIYIYSICLQPFFTSVQAQLVPPQQEDSLAASDKPVKISYQYKGFTLQTADKRFEFQIQSRLQFRFSTPGDQDPQTFDDFREGKKRVLKINRARLKVGGHAFYPWLKYYWEYELSAGNLLDFKIMFEKWKAFSIKIGQWKTDFNRERVISSGEQQMIERSIINKPFTLDRQQGIAVYGRLKGKGPADFNYWFSALTGSGRGASTNDDKNLMYVGRVQWNFLGEELQMSGSDIDHTKKPAGLIALAGVTNRSPYTRFSQAGGGYLDGFTGGAPGQYRVNQLLIETAFKYKGFSWQHESHWKKIDDKINQAQTDLRGSYFQAGYFFHDVLGLIPRHLETAFRFANYRPNMDQPDNTQKEYSMAFNFFMNEHHNKLSSEFTWFSFQDTMLDMNAGGLRFRLQWDISL